MYITMENGVRIVRCKAGCQTVLVRGADPTAEYTEVVLAMREPNGMFSKHETAVCRACRERLIAGAAPGEIERLYAEDIEQMIEEDIRANHSIAMSYRMAERQAMRTPLRVLDEPSRTGAV